MTAAIQHSFASGEIAPALYSRADHTRYASGLKTCRNFIISKSGGAKNRPGTTMIRELIGGNVTGFPGYARLIPFVYSQSQSFVVSIESDGIRFTQNGNPVLESAINISAITNANPCTVTTLNPHGYNTGDVIFFPSVTGMTQLNARFFKITVIDTTHFSLNDIYSGAGTVDSTNYGVYTGGNANTIQRVYTVPHSYAVNDIPSINFAQNGNSLILVHPTYQPQVLTFTSATSWALSALSFFPAQQMIGKITGVTAGAAGTATYSYMITTLNNTTGEESTPGATFLRTGSSVDITRANPAVANITAHPFVEGDQVTIYNSGVSGVDGIVCTLHVVDVNHVQLNGIDGSGWSGPAIVATFATTFYTITCTPPTAAAPNTVTYTFPGTSNISFNIYLSIGGSGIYGFIGNSANGTFKDPGITPNTAVNPPGFKQVFYSPGNYPSGAVFYQQRLGLFNSNNAQQNASFSVIGKFFNFTSHQTVIASDAVFFQVAGTKYNPIQWMIDMGKLVIGTQFSEYAAVGDATGALTPVAINLQQQSANGSSSLRPVIVNGSAIYVQSRGSVLRDLLFDFVTDGYKGNDLTVFSQHLFDNFSVRDMDYAQIPNSIVWLVRNDGTLLGLTYVREQQIFAWHHHDTAGTFENIAVVPEGSDDAVYVTVSRTMNGITRRFIERLQTRTILPANINTAVFTDSTQIYNGLNTVQNNNTNVTLTGGTNWDDTEILALSTDNIAHPISALLKNANEVLLVGADGNYVRCNVVGINSGNSIAVKPTKKVPLSLQGTFTFGWTAMVNTVSGLWRFNGMNVSVYGDGTVVGSPNNLDPVTGNPAYPTLTVANGSLTLPHAYGVINVGLPYTCDLRTLNLETVGYQIFAGQTLVDKNKLVSKVAVQVENTRGIFAGPYNPDGNIQNTKSNPLYNMTEFKTRAVGGAYDNPPDLFTDALVVNINPEWNSNGSVFFRVVDPVPTSILSVTVAGFFPMRQ